MHTLVKFCAKNIAEAMSLPAGGLSAYLLTVLLIWSIMNKTSNRYGEYDMAIHLEKLNNENWLEAANLSVSEKQKEIFPIPNAYWIGISRYEEHTTLYAIMLDENIVGMIGMGYDEDGVSGFINPLMIDKAYQGKHYAKDAMTIAIEILRKEYNAPRINLGHRKENSAAAKLYEKLGFEITGEDEQDYFRTKIL